MMKTKATRMSVTLAEEQHAKLERLAQETGLSISDLIRHYIFVASKLQAEQGQGSKILIRRQNGEEVPVILISEVL